MTELKARLPKLLVIVIFLGGVGLLVSNIFGSSSGAREGASPLRLPELSRVAASGKRAFDANCAQCHGVNATGSDKGPPLIHRIYNPGHHADESFFRAVRDGVRRHHWNFGDMPAQRQVTQAQTEEIVAYVREIQVVNGIVHEPHRM